jgi:signal recognition particle subunit SRP19
MSQSARIEELSDDDSDPEVADISTLPSTDPKRPSLNPEHQPRVTDPGAIRHWQSIYPIYFDSSRGRTAGRRVTNELAVSNPLARTIADAIASLGLRCVFDPGKTHPQDWANPGRVKVETRNADGEWIAAARGVNNKRHLMVKVAEYLQAHPTTREDPLRVQIKGMPEVKEALPGPAVPRGWKVNSVLPLHSPAVTGGGVSENFLKDMMSEMQGLPAGQGGQVEGSGGKPARKEKGKKKK